MLITGLARISFGTKFEPIFQVLKHTWNAWLPHDGLKGICVTFTRVWLLGKAQFRHRVWFEGKSCFLLYLSRWLDSGAIKSNDCSRSLRDSMTRLGEESWAGKNENTSSHRGTISQYHLSKLEGQPISEPSAQTCCFVQTKFSSVRKCTYRRKTV